MIVPDVRDVIRNVTYPTVPETAERGPDVKVGSFLFCEADQTGLSMTKLTSNAILAWAQYTSALQSKIRRNAPLEPQTTTDEIHAAFNAELVWTLHTSSTAYSAVKSAQRKVA